MNLTAAENRMLTMLGEKGKPFSLCDRETLLSRLVGLVGASFVGLITVTEPKMRKTGNPYAGKVVKVARTSGQVNFDYDGAVGRAREKEGKPAEDWQKGESWHEPYMIDGKYTPFCRHKKDGTLYVRVRHMGGSSVYIDKDTGEEVDKELLKPFLPDASYGNQGLDKGDEVRFVTYKLDSVRAATVKGETLVVR